MDFYGFERSTREQSWRDGWAIRKERMHKYLKRVPSSGQISQKRSGGHLTVLLLLKPPYALEEQLTNELRREAQSDVIIVVVMLDVSLVKMTIRYRV